MTVSEGGSFIQMVSRQDASGMAAARSRKRSRLIQCHMLRQQAVRSLKPSLFFCRQRHILNEVSVTFLLAS